METFLACIPSVCVDIPSFLRPLQTCSSLWTPLLCLWLYENSNCKRFIAQSVKAKCLCVGCTRMTTAPTHSAICSGAEQEREERTRSNVCCVSNRHVHILSTLFIPAVLLISQQHIHRTPYIAFSALFICSALHHTQYASLYLPANGCGIYMVDISASDN